VCISTSAVGGGWPFVSGWKIELFIKLPKMSARSYYSFSLLAHLTTDVPWPREPSRDRAIAFAIVESIGDFHVAMRDAQKE
jgi:hypothetical protein